MSKLFLVTGATGFLGSHLVKSLLKQNYQVIILKRSFSDTWRINDVLSELIIFDLDCCEIEQPFKEIKKIDAIIHTSTCYGRHGESISDIFTTNTFFPLKLIETALSFNVNTFINTDTSVNKFSVPYLGLPNYSLSKYQFLQWGKLFSSIDNFRFVNLIVEYMFGPYDNESNLVSYVIQNCLTNSEELKLTPGEQQRDFIYINDVVAAYIHLLKNIDHVVTGYIEYELGVGKSISLRQFVETIHHLTNSSTQLNFGALPYRDSEIMHSQANIEPLNKLGWFPQWKLEDGLRETINSMNYK